MSYNRNVWFSVYYSQSPTPFDDQPISVKSSIVDIAYDYTKKKNVIRLTTYNGSEYLFQAEDHDVMLQWIRVIQALNNPEQNVSFCHQLDVQWNLRLKITFLERPLYLAEDCILHVFEPV